MARFLRLWRRLPFLLRRRQFDRDLEEEMRFHLEMKAAELGDAYRARKEFGSGPAARSIVPETRRALGSPGGNSGTGFGVHAQTTLGTPKPDPDFRERQHCPRGAENAPWDSELSHRILRGSINA